jgi:hypothetical protein
MVVIFGALLRIYVYEQEHSIVDGSNTKRGIVDESNDIIMSSLKEFKSNPKGKNENIQRNKKALSSSTATTTTSTNNDKKTQDESPHYHTLQCAAYGGPSEEDAQEMVYWKGKKEKSSHLCEKILFSMGLVKQLKQLISSHSSFLSHINTQYYETSSKQTFPVILIMLVHFMSRKPPLPYNNI